MRFLLFIRKGLPLCLLLLISLTTFHCKTPKYAKTDKVYKNLAKDFAKTIQAAPPQSQTIDSLSADQQYWVGTVNMGIRRPNFVIIHHTAQDSTAQTLKTFTITKTQVSAHYVIGRDGKVYQMVNDYLRAQHAGESKWGNSTDLNSSSIGIELDNNGFEPFSDIQIENLCALLETLKRKYKIPTANFIGHADIAPTRKPDPSNFPWQILAQKGYGLWYDPIMETPPMELDSASALRIIGYDIRKMDAAIIAFKRHFIQNDITPVLTVWDKTVLNNLYKKYL
ncbi:N-acetylmuramoyl-L-alanine amidase [Dyadobacter psychrotolerans]|uniref:N-acetylmuramoyl-L-alanine amidase n=1 Tax=Dyadobacter psychrotolerans TaxID=2541721 RepID=A0A4R5DXJ6_9BACT|nr:N-acetylmuramoyl-L-alanine amidase [Dyadobacter psychrotolerans]TDE17190.1 N-acetylmuramoyl-L-alanine amidase [Dyadobacter psychrotolerans]